MTRSKIFTAASLIALSMAGLATSASAYDQIDARQARQESRIEPFEAQEVEPAEPAVGDPPRRALAHRDDANEGPVRREVHRAAVHAAGGGDRRSRRSRRHHAVGREPLDSGVRPDAGAG